MQNIVIPETDNTPYVNFNFQEGFFEIKGVSFPEHAKEFFEPLLENLKHYALNPPTSKSIVMFKFIYFNTGTNTLITGILKEMENLVKKGYDVEVFWYYEQEDEDMRELGEYFKTLSTVPIQFVACERL